MLETNERVEANNGYRNGDPEVCKISYLTYHPKGKKQWEEVLWWGDRKPPTNIWRIGMHWRCFLSWDVKHFIIFCVIVTINPLKLKIWDCCINVIIICSDWQANWFCLSKKYVLQKAKMYKFSSLHCCFISFATSNTPKCNNHEQKIIIWYWEPGWEK